MPPKKPTEKRIEILRNILRNKSQSMQELGCINKCIMLKLPCKLQLLYEYNTYIVF